MSIMVMAAIAAHPAHHSHPANHQSLCIAIATSIGPRPRLFFTASLGSSSGGISGFSSSCHSSTFPACSCGLGRFPSSAGRTLSRALFTGAASSSGICGPKCSQIMPLGLRFVVSFFFLFLFFVWIARYLVLLVFVIALELWFCWVVHSSSVTDSCYEMGRWVCFVLALSWVVVLIFAWIGCLVGRLDLA